LGRELYASCYRNARVLVVLCWSRLSITDFCTLRGFYVGRRQTQALGCVSSKGKDKISIPLRGELFTLRRVPGATWGGKKEKDMIFIIWISSDGSELVPSIDV